jgi:hypothetical protein
MSDYLVIDIETIPDRSLWTPPPPGPDGREEWPPPFACRIVTIGTMLLDKSLVPKWTLASEKDEREVLGKLAAWCEKIRPTFVSWSGRSFDLPVMMARSFRYGIAWPFYYTPRSEWRYRYTDAGHLDLCDAISDHGAGRYGKLDHAARSIGLPGKRDVDGSKVEALVAEGKLLAVRNYCLEDVATTALVFLRYLVLRGTLSVADFQAKAKVVLAEMEKQPALETFLAAVDRDVYLLEPESTKT